MVDYDGFGNLDSSALSNNGNTLLAMVKTYYAKNGVENLLYRNDDFLKKIKKVRVHGKSANFSALYSRGGAVAANYTEAKQIAKSTAQAAEFQVTPGQLFSCCTYNNRETLMSRNLGYIDVACAKFWSSLESFRKTLAVALYSKGYGEIMPDKCSAVDSIATSGANAGVFTLTLPTSAVMAIDVGSKVDFCSALGTVTFTAEVETINGTTVKFKAESSITEVAESYICLHGCTIGGTPMLPKGLAAWIPDTVATTDSFFGVNRSVSRDRLAGIYLEAEADASTSTGKAPMYKTLTKAIMALRRAGSLCDVIVMNDNDYITLQEEIENKTNFMKTFDAKGKGKFNVGYDGFGFGVSKNFLDNVIDSSFCPKGTAYILDSSTIELWTYTNADKINDGVGDTGKAEIAEDSSVVDKPYQALVDDMITVNPGEDTYNGPATLIALSFYGNFVVTNPSVNGRVKLN